MKLNFNKRHKKQKVTKKVSAEAVAYDAVFYFTSIIHVQNVSIALSLSHLLIWTKHKVLMAMSFADVSPGTKLLGK